MRTEDAKRHIYHTKKPVKAEDVRKIIAAIKKAGRITKDRTGEGHVSHIWDGTRPFPVLPEDSRLTLLLEDEGEVTCGLTQSIRFSSSETKKSAAWTALSKAIELSVLKEDDFLNVSNHKSAKQSEVSGIFFEVYLGANPKRVGIYLKPKVGPNVAVKFEVLSGLLNAGSWPVTVEVKGDSLTARHSAGGTAVWDAEKSCLNFTVPSFSNQEVVAALAKSVCSSKHPFDSLMCHIKPPKKQHSWKGFNEYLRQLEKVATPKMELNLGWLSWRPNGYESFEAMAGMLEAFPDDDQLMSRMFEFQFAGQLGFMELSCEAKGFRPWFSFDVETPFKELEKAIGYPLMAMR